jgi:hypothetical protein
VSFQSGTDTHHSDALLAHFADVAELLPQLMTTCTFDWEVCGTMSEELLARVKDVPFRSYSYLCGLATDVGRRDARRWWRGSVQCAKVKICAVKSSRAQRKFGHRSSRIYLTPITAQLCEIWGCLQTDLLPPIK